MAKKAKKKAPPARAAKKPAGKQRKENARKWSSGQGKQRAAEMKDRTRVPRQPALIPGALKGDSRALNASCANIADNRAAIARLQAEEKDMERHAHEQMRKEGRTNYSAAGVTLVRVPGEEKLIVRRSRDGASTTATETNEADEIAEDAQEANDELGTGQGLDGHPVLGDVDDAGNDNAIEDTE